MSRRTVSKGPAAISNDAGERARYRFRNQGSVMPFGITAIIDFEQFEICIRSGFFGIFGKRGPCKVHGRSSLSGIAPTRTLQFGSVVFPKML